jgi:hypothetical protein
LIDKEFTKIFERVCYTCGHPLTGYLPITLMRNPKNEPVEVCSECTLFNLVANERDSKNLVLARSKRDFSITDLTEIHELVIKSKLGGKWGDKCSIDEEEED